MSLILVLSLFFVSTLARPVSAIDITLTEEQSTNIRENCDSIKQSLKRVQNSDRNTRVSLGRSYQQILSDFITPLNVRLVKNNRFNSSLNELQNSFVTEREKFNQEYITYSQALETLLSTDCKSNSIDFYARLVATREARGKVAKEVKSLEGIINKHTETVKNLKNSFHPKEEVKEND